MLVGFVNHWATTGTPSMPFSMGNATAWSLQIGFYFIYLFIFGYTRGMWKFLGQGWNLCHSSNSSCHSDKARALIPRTPKIGLKTNSNNKKLFHFVLCYMSIPPKFPNWRTFFFVCLFVFKSIHHTLWISVCLAPCDLDWLKGPMTCIPVAYLCVPLLGDQELRSDFCTPSLAMLTISKYQLDPGVFLAETVR